jgi:serine/threonine-protein kinase
MGIVYEALHKRLGQRVAVKMLLPDLVESEEAVARFEREARAAAHLRSPHAARVFDVDILPDGTPYFVMEYLNGRNLSDELAERGRFPIEEAVDYVLQACDAMAEAHRLGIVHRDLKPSNLFLADDGHQFIVKVLDFGISKFADGLAPLVTTTRTGLGTVVYMSPEQVRSAKSVDARSDVWALGVVLYELLAGSSPFDRDTSTAVVAAIIADKPQSLRSHREDVPVLLEAVVMQALEKNRERRFVDAAALAGALTPFAPPRDKRPVRSPKARAVRTPSDSAIAGQPSDLPYDPTAKSAFPGGMLEATRKDKPAGQAAATPPDAAPLVGSDDSSSRDGDTLQSGARPRVDQAPASPGALKEAVAPPVTDPSQEPPLSPVPIPPNQSAKGPRITDGPVRPIIISAMPPPPSPRRVKPPRSAKRSGVPLAMAALLAALAISAVLIWEMTQESSRSAAVTALPNAAPTAITSTLPLPNEENHAARAPEIVTDTPATSPPVQASPTATASAVTTGIVPLPAANPPQPRATPRTRKPSKTPMQERTGLPSDPG